MEYLTSEELRDWISHPTTRKIQKRFKEVVLNEKLEAVSQMGVNQLYDRYKAGYIAGLEMASSYESLFEEEAHDVKGKRTQSPY